MTIKKVDGYATVHCRGRDKGKIIHKFRTRKEALAQHRAIMVSKHKHHSANDGKFLEARRKKFGA